MYHSNPETPLDLQQLDTIVAGAQAGDQAAIGNVYNALPDPAAIERVEIAHLFEQARAEDEIATQELFARMHHRAIQVATRNQASDPEAVAQETMLRLWTKAVRNPEFTVTDIGGWIKVVAQNLTMDSHRRNRHTVTEPLDTIAEPTDLTHSTRVRQALIASSLRYSVEETHDTQSQAAMVTEALTNKSINPNFMKAVALQYDGYSCEEISTILEVPLATVRTRIFRGKKALLELRHARTQANVQTENT